MLLETLMWRLEETGILSFNFPRLFVEALAPNPRGGGPGEEILFKWFRYSAQISQLNLCLRRKREKKDQYQVASIESSLTAAFRRLHSLLVFLNLVARRFKRIGSWRTLCARLMKLTRRVTRIFWVWSAASDRRWFESRSRQTAFDLWGVWLMCLWRCHGYNYATAGGGGTGSFFKHPEYKKNPHRS